MKLQMQKKEILMRKNITSKTQDFYILLAFILITVALLIAVSIYCCLIKFGTKYLLPFRDTKIKTNLY